MVENANHRGREGEGGGPARGRRAAHQCRPRGRTPSSRAAWPRSISSGPSCTPTSRRRSTRPSPRRRRWSRPHADRRSPYAVRPNTRPRPRGRTRIWTPRTCGARSSGRPPRFGSRSPSSGSRRSARCGRPTRRRRPRPRQCWPRRPSTTRSPPPGSRPTSAKAARIRAEASAEAEQTKLSARQRVRGPDRHRQEAGDRDQRADPAGIRLAQAAAAARDRAVASAQAGGAEPVGQPVRAGRADRQRLPGPRRPVRPRVRPDCASRDLTAPPGLRPPRLRSRRCADRERADRQHGEAGFEHRSPASREPEPRTRAGARGRRRRNGSRRPFRPARRDRTPGRAEDKVELIVVGACSWPDPPRATTLTSLGE